MARKKSKSEPETTSTLESPATHHELDVFDDAIAARQAQATVTDLAQSTRLPEEPATHAPEREPGQSHADAVKKRKHGYNKQGKSDYVVGASILEHHDPYLSVIRFEEKPSDEVRKKLRDEGFQWQQANQEWTRAISYETRQQDRLSADRTFDEVCQILRKERGIGHDFGGAG